MDFLDSASNFWMDLKKDLNSNVCVSRDKEPEQQAELIDLNDSQELKNYDDSFDLNFEMESKQSIFTKEAPSTLADTEFQSIDQSEEIFIQQKVQNQDIRKYQSQESFPKQKRMRNQWEVTNEDLLQILSKEELQLLDQQRPIQDLSQTSYKTQLLNKKLKFQPSEQLPPQPVNIPQQQNTKTKSNSGKLTEELENRLNNLESLVAPLSMLKKNPSYANQLKRLEEQILKPPTFQQQMLNQQPQPITPFKCNCRNCSSFPQETVQQQNNFFQGQQPSVNKKEQRQQAIQRLYQRMQNIEKLLLETKTEITQIESMNQLKKKQGNYQFYHMNNNQKTHASTMPQMQETKQETNEDLGSRNSNFDIDASNYFE